MSNKYTCSKSLCILETRTPQFVSGIIISLRNFTFLNNNYETGVPHWFKLLKAIYCILIVTFIELKMTNLSDLHNLIVYVNLLEIDTKSADVVWISLRKSAAVSDLIWTAVGTQTVRFSTSILLLLVSPCVTTCRDDV